jgi:hypothetical protein
VQALDVTPDAPIPPGEARHAAIHRERVEAIDGLRERIKVLEEREPELRKEIAEFEKAERTTLAELEQTQRLRIAELEKAERATIAELEQTQRTTIAEVEQTLRAEPENAEVAEVAEQLTRTRIQLAEELERTDTELTEQLARTRTELAEELERTRNELAEERARMRAEHASIAPTLIETRCKLGMKMSDFALDEDEGHEEAIDYLKPLLAELGDEYRRALQEAERNAAEADEKLTTLQAEHHETAEAALPLVEQRFQFLIDAQIKAAVIEQASVRVDRHRLALVDPDDKDARLTCELELEAALELLAAARAKVSTLQEERKAAEFHYSHPTAEKRKRLGEKLTKRLGHHQ